ncbi:MAG: adenylate/guanylate cyclase domain-containing protein [Microcoleaceae cyanobacterium]
MSWHRSRLQHRPQDKQARHTPYRQPAERRHLTVMFCDLVGSTAISEQLDPEELRDLIQKYQQTCANILMRVDGYIAQYLGDGILVYFGYPNAHENDAQRAIKAALGIIKAMKKIKLSCIREHNIQLAVRLGIHTGLVVVGEVGAGNKKEQLAIGQTPNIAARLQGLAQPNTAVLSPSTYRLVRDIFEVESLGKYHLKGVSQPVEAYQVLWEVGYCKRMKVAADNWISYVGREEELEQLQQSWERVKTGTGEIFLIVGEAGIGKSRLLQTFKQRIAQQSHSLRELYCSSYYQNTPFHPLVELLRDRVIQLNREDTPAEKLTKLENFLQKNQVPLEEFVPLFADLFNIPLNEHYTALNLSPKAQKQKLLEVMLIVIRQTSIQEPLLVIVEDLHWVDPSTLELINLLIENGLNNPILRIYTTRPGFKSQWSDLPGFHQINLSHLSPQQIEKIALGVTQNKLLPPAVMRLLIQKSDGIPLFVEEMTKMVIESGWLKEAETGYQLMGTLPHLAIPDTLKGLLMERLDRLDTAKEVAQLGAIIGREFSYELLRSIALKQMEVRGSSTLAFDEYTITQGLERLVETRLLFMKGELPTASYMFRNVLIQDAAYDSLLRSTRQQYHQRIATVLEADFPDIVEQEPELLAYHYTRARQPQSAISYWQQAGQMAFMACANEEAIAHLHSGLELINQLPKNTERLQQELLLQTTLGKVLIATKGYAASEVEQVYSRSEDLCQQLGTTRQLFSILWGLFGYHAARAEYRLALEFASRLMGLARRENDSVLEMEAHFTMGLALFYLGHLPAARDHWQDANTLYQTLSVNCQTCLTGQDVGVASRSFLAWCQWLLGTPEQALASSQEAVTLANYMAHPYSQGLAFSLAAMFHQCRSDTQQVQQFASQALNLAQEQQFPFWFATGIILQGWVKVQQGEFQTGIAQIRQGIEAHAATGAKISWTYFLGILASAYGKAGQIQAGLAVLEEAFVAAETTEEKFWVNELNQIKNKLLIELEPLSESRLE